LKMKNMALLDARVGSFREPDPRGDRQHVRGEGGMPDWVEPLLLSGSIRRSELRV
jgi:hypothetical protein